MKKIIIIILCLLFLTIGLFAQDNSADNNIQTEKVYKFFLGAKVGYLRSLVKGGNAMLAGGVGSMQGGLEGLYKLTSVIGIKFGLGVNSFGRNFSSYSIEYNETFKYLYLETELQLKLGFFLLYGGFGANFKMSTSSDATYSGEVPGVKSSFIALVFGFGFIVDAGSVLIPITLDVKVNLTDIFDNSYYNSSLGNSLFAVYINIGILFGL